MKILPILASLALVSACGQGERQPAQPQPKIKVRSAEQDALHKMSDLNRAIGLKRTIYGSGSTCKRVTETRFIGEYKNMDMWGVRCADGRDWALFIAPDNSVQVRLCRDTEKVGLPACGLDQPKAAS